MIPEGWLLNVVSHNWKIDKNDRFGLLLSACRDCIGDVWVKEENARLTNVILPEEKKEEMKCLIEKRIQVLL